MWAPDYQECVPIPAMAQGVPEKKKQDPIIAKPKNEHNDLVSLFHGGVSGTEE